MAKIENKTIASIYEHYENVQKDWRRPHLGASLIGKKCPRAIWYSFRWCAAPEFPGRILRLFQTGVLEEHRLVKDLRDLGIVVYDRDPNNGTAQIHYADPECGGHFAGSLDGVGHGFQEAMSWHVLEFKTSNAKGFAALKKNGVEKAKPEHYAQMQCYMHWSGLIRAYYFCVCKDTDEIYGERVRYDIDAARALTEKAKNVIFASEPPERISVDGGSYECRYCAYKNICHGEQLPEVNCRTCAHATPVLTVNKGQWICARAADGIIDLEKQKRNDCMLHVYVPALIHADVSDADSAAGTITYSDGTVNGPGATSSLELLRRVSK